ncbi:MAG TPA: hypothetical protein PKJ41_09280 [Bryobacteraceae bacterium]|nr:hypothetical protein [Bryobacteraceae bacterium]HPT27725.1 hypothetical protein [Bryobacteraceae bacterium]
MTNLSIASLCWTALAFAAFAPAQDTKETPKPAPAARPGCCIQKVYRVKNVDTRALWNALHVSRSDNTGPSLRADETLKVISIYGTRDEVNSIMANLQELDVPSAGRGAVEANAEITVWLVAASTSGDAQGDPLPPDLLPVLKTVAGSFGYKSFSLMDSAVSLTKAGSSFNVRGNATPPTPKLTTKMVASYTIDSYSVRIESAGETRTISLERFNFSIGVPYCTDADCTKTERTNVVINGSFNIREGQKVVIGKSKMDGSTKDLILIVNAKVVD